jgi:hypothetical protein
MEDGVVFKHHINDSDIKLKSKSSKNKQMGITIDEKIGFGDVKTYGNHFETEAMERFEKMCLALSCCSERHFGIVINKDSSHGCLNLQ